ncbi:MAG: hypothetical protein JWO11_3563 [Nocardioides sp.]|nr:hypothetical protein [Nocardioides sp.]
MMWLFVFFLWVMCAALISMALGKAIRIGDLEQAQRNRVNQAIAVLELQFHGGAR